MKLLCLLLFTMFADPIYAQLSGAVTDEETGESLGNAPVIIVHEQNEKRCLVYSDSLGIFHSELDKEGMYSVSVSALGYHPIKFDKLFISSNHIKYLEIALTQKQYLINEVVVAPSAWGVDRSGGISTYEINPHLMNLTVGSSYDILRSATLIPGVSNTADASNDLNIRGNSPFGINWYIEGAPVVSPNHFTDNNSSGGVFSIFDSWGVNKTQLFMSAFPVQYGNAISGILDTELRTGNFRKFQGNVNFSTVSAGAVLETPIKKDKSSLIGGFRYTFPDFIHKTFPAYSEKLGTVPDILDGFFKFHSVINPNFKISLWAIGGKSNAAFRYSGESNETLSLQRSGNSISSGLSLNYNKNAISFKTNVYTSHRNSYEYIARKHSIDSDAGWTGINSKLSVRNTNSKILFGADFKRQYYSQYREIISLNKDSIHTDFANDFSSFLSYTYYFDNNFMFQVGVRYLYNGLVEKHRLEPRIELRKQLASPGTISLAFSEHSINNPVQYLYSYERGIDNKGDEIVTRNKVLIPLLKSRHFILGWDKKYKNKLKLGSELFYQHLYDASNVILSKGYTHNPYSYGGIILGVSSTPPTTSSIGRNYGIELSLDAPISSKNMYFYLAGTLFNSEYKHGDGEWTPTLFNSSFSLTSAFRKEFILSN